MLISCPDQSIGLDGRAPGAAAQRRDTSHAYERTGTTRAREQGRHVRENRDDTSETTGTTRAREQGRH